MKRALALFFLAFWFWGIAPVGANTVPAIRIACDTVTFSWIDFPTHDVLLTVTVTQGDEKTVASFNTDGKRSGDGSVPVQLRNGPASATVEWSLKKSHSVGPVTANLDCDTTTTTTTVPRTTVPPTSPPSTAPPVECGPDTLACTGPQTATDALVVGGTFVGLGALLLAATRRKPVR